MGCGSSKPATIESSPLEQVGHQHPLPLPSPAPAPPTPVPPFQPLAPVPAVVPAPEGTSGNPAHNTAPHVGEIPSPEPNVPVERKRSRTSPRPGDGGGYPSSPPGGVVVEMPHTHRSEMDSTQHQSRKRVASKLGKSPSMDLLGGARSHPSDRITRTASTSVIPNTYPPVGPQHPLADPRQSPAGPLHPYADPRQPPAGPSHPSAGPLFQSQPVSRAGPVQAKRQETRPQFPPNLQSLLSNDFRFRILVAGRRESGKSSLINAVFNVDMSGVPKNVPGRTADFRPRDNRHLIVHECSGSGPGDFQAIRDFVTMYTHKNRPAPERLHAIWICVPVLDVMKGQFDESVKMLLGFRVPVVVVFTMFDMIVPNIARRNDYEDAWTAASTKCEEFRHTLFGNVRSGIVSTQPKFSNSIEQLVKTTDDVIIAPLRNVSVSSERQRTQSRIFPVALAWSVSQRASRDIKIQAAIEVGRSRYWNGLKSSDDFAGRTLASCVEVIHADIVGVWNLPDKDRYLSSSAFKAEIYQLVQDLSTSARSQPNGTPGTAGWLSNRYENSNENICLVVGYIVDLTLILCGVFGSPGNTLFNKVQSVKHKFVSSGLKANIHAEICRFIETVPKFKYLENDVVISKITDLVNQQKDSLV